MRMLAWALQAIYPSNARSSVPRSLPPVAFMTSLSIVTPHGPRLDRVEVGHVHQYLHDVRDAAMAGGLPMYGVRVGSGWRCGQAGQGTKAGDSCRYPTPFSADKPECRYGSVVCLVRVFTNVIFAGMR